MHRAADHKSIVRSAQFMVVLFVLLFVNVQPSAPDSVPLIAFLFTWHTTARGSGQWTPTGLTESGGMQHVGQTAGSAIVRFMISPDKHLWPYDTRYLSLVVTDSFQFWHVLKTGCAGYDSAEIVNPTENAGLYVPHGPIYFGLPSRSAGQLLDESQTRPGNLTVIPRPFRGLHELQFTMRYETKYSQCGPAYKDSSTDFRESTNNATGMSTAAEVWQHFVLQAARPHDDSIFTLRAEFSSPSHELPPGMPAVMFNDQVEWTAEAHRLGTCPCATGPLSETAGLSWPSSNSPSWISATDSHITDGSVNEEITIQVPVDPINPNGTIPGANGVAEIADTEVTLTLTTCAGIPVRGITADHPPHPIDDLEVTVDPVRFSGGHQHDDKPRPGGMLNGQEIDKKPSYPSDPFALCPAKCIRVRTDWNGQVKIRFKPPYATTSSATYGSYDVGVAGDYTISARSIQQNDTKESKKITAAVRGLNAMPDDPTHYLLVRDGIDSHKLGFYATDGTRANFKALAIAFLSAQNDHNANLHQQKKDMWPIHELSINDIALPTGGIFDWQKTWKPSHQTHNKGEGGDFNRFGEISDGQLVIDSDGSSVGLRGWLLHKLLDLGTVYGHWDCYDLGAGVATGPALEVGLTKTQCFHANFPDPLFYPFDPLRTLHLHVED